MNSIIKADLLDIFKVSGVSFGAIGFTQQNILQLNEIIQQAGNTLVILLAIGYGAIKMIKVFREVKWQKEDREKRSSLKD